MAKLIIVFVITFVSVSAQFVSERRSYEGENLRINSDELRVNEEYQQGALRVNNRNSEHRIVGGFQNGNFAQSDGRLRTNLGSGVVSESSGQNFQPKDSLFVEEGAAFRRPGNGQYDVHSSLGRNVDVSIAATEDYNSNERRRSQNRESQRKGERIEHRTTNNQNLNWQPDSIQAGHVDEQDHTGNLNNYQNIQENNGRGNGNHDGITNFDQNTRQTDRNYDNNPQNERNNNQNTFNTQQTINQESGIYEGHTNSRLNTQNMDTQYDAKNNGQNRFNKPNTQTSETNTRNNEKLVPKIDSRTSSRANADKMINQQNKEAMDRELNNQITKMIFEESTQAGSPHTKTTKDNELPPRSSSGKQDDRWIWSDGTEVKNVTTTVVPTVDDRAAFAGDQCPTGLVKINNVCVEAD